MNDQGNAGNSPPPDGETGRRLKRWGLAALGLAFVVLVLITIIEPIPSADLPIAYSTLVEQVKAGNIEAVTFKGQRVTGTFTKEMRLVDDELLAPGDALPPGARPAEIRSSKTFTTTLPPGAESHLLELLEEQGVAVRAVATNGAWWRGLLSAFVWVLPLLIIVWLFFGMTRGVTRERDRLFGFGRVRARVFDPQRPHVTFADIAGEDEAKAELAQVVDFLRNPQKYRRLGAQLPHGILLIGPPGTGKTLLAKAVAGEASVPFYSISASEFVEVFVGVGASRVRDLFARARASAPSIVFVDELDAVGRQRFAGIGGGNDEREQTLNQLLVELDGFEPHEQVVVLAATNRPDVLDPALLRPGRFDRHVALGLPDRRGRAAILQLHVRKVRLAPDVDLEALAAATPGFAGADLANLVNEAALHAARLDKPVVDREDFDAALDRIMLGSKRPLLIGEREQRILAYHEAGHAIAAHFTPGADPLRKITIVPRGQALGVTIQVPEGDRFTFTRTDLLGRLTVMMGGRAAETLVFNELTTGAQNDLKDATALARRMVGLWGMSEEVGPLFLGLGEQHVFLGRELAEERAISQEMLDRAEAAVQRLLTNALDRATALLVEHRDALDRLAGRLMVEETLNQAEIFALIGEPQVELPVAAGGELIAGGVATRSGPGAS